MTRLAALAGVLLFSPLIYAALWILMPSDDSTETTAGGPAPQLALPRRSLG